MVVSCVAVSCENRHGKKLGLGFYRFPAHPKRRLMWIKAVKRKNWTPSRHSRVCGDHFVSGKPVNKPDDVDYVPTLFSYNCTPVTSHMEITKRQSTQRNERHSKRMLLVDALHFEVCNDEEVEESIIDDEHENNQHIIDGVFLQSKGTQTESSVVNESTQTVSEPCVVVNESTQTPPITVPYAILPCYVPSSTSCSPSQLTIIANNNEATKFYTGLSSWDMFQYLSSLLAQYKPQSTLNKLPLADELLLTLMRLRLNLKVNDLAYRFDIGVTTVSRAFSRMINNLFMCLKCLIVWPSKEMVQSNLPPIFKDLYPNTRCIIDCTEIFIERPHGYMARAQSYSNYKKHNTVKFLIAVTPCGAISFLSKCWGGRASDRCITQSSGIMSLLESGDVVLADRGFTISEDLSLHGVVLEIPAFKRGNKQLSLKEVEESKRLSKVRIHVERVIGLLKNKYTILKGRLPITILRHKDDSDDYSFIDKILTVCASLCNLSPSVVIQ